MIRKALAKDVSSIVSLHMSALPRDLLPRIGRRYLEEVFFPSVVGSELALTLVNDECGSITGFIVFTDDAEALNQTLFSNKVLLLKWLTLALLKDLSLLREVLSHFIGAKKEFVEGAGQDFKIYPELYLLAIDPVHQGQGIGSQLVSAGFDAIGNRFASCSVRTSSDKAKKFYEKCGFNIVGYEFRGGRVLNLMLKKRLG